MPKVYNLTLWNNQRDKLDALKANLVANGGVIVHEYTTAAVGFIFRMTDPKATQPFATDIREGKGDIVVKAFDERSETTEVPMAKRQKRDL